jgi:hypothetical protein
VAEGAVDRGKVEAQQVEGEGEDKERGRGAKEMGGARVGRMGWRREQKWIGGGQQMWANNAGVSISKGLGCGVKWMWLHNKGWTCQFYITGVLIELMQGCSTL